MVMRKQICFEGEKWPVFSQELFPVNQPSLSAKC